MQSFVWSIDASLKNTGIAIFTEYGGLEQWFSIPTDQKDETQNRLKYIADVILAYQKNYPASLLVLEKGFTQFNIATQIIYRVVGLLNYLFCDVNQIYYPATTIKKTITGTGKADKKVVRKTIEKFFPGIEIQDEDQSDAIATGLTYFIKEKKLSFGE